MCGIFGVIKGESSALTRKETKSLIDRLFILSEQRGKESAGIAIKNPEKKSIAVYKNALTGSKLIKSKPFENLLNSNLDHVFAAQKSLPLSVIGHTRLVTNGDQSNNNNNQPVLKNDFVGVHNGIICNIEELWAEEQDLVRENEVDTEWLFGELSNKISANASPQNTFKDVFDEVEGTVSAAGFHAKYEHTFLASNNGSLYFVSESNGGSILFSSERLILEDLIAQTKTKKFDGATISWLDLNDLYLIDDITAEVRHLKFDSIEKMDLNAADYTITNSSPENIKNKETLILKEVGHYSKMFEYNFEEIAKLKRCSKCLLPETFPFIAFDLKGECNYCASHQKIIFKGMEALKEQVYQHKKDNGRADCIVTLSGGRDSCYGLHVMKEELGMNPIAYTYDWGMVTDLARRNQARMCGALGVEHVLISADITKKRSNIHKNVSAWLKKPNLGTIPLFMAGDKQYFYWANYLQKRYNTPLVILCENMLETTNFKSGFCGIEPKFGTEHTFSLSGKDKAKMLAFYGKEYLTNPSYLNSSIQDTVHAFFTYYFSPKNYLNMFDYLPWDEKTVENTLFDGYNWEVSDDTTTTWRIGDGTAAFYNYIYYNVAGFSEFDTFRSNQIREGSLTREEALKIAEQENRPRIESFLWYCETINIDPEYALKVINAIPKLYRTK